jgi:hypothetical protein
MKKPFIPSKQDPYLKWHDTLKGGVTATTTGATADDVAMLETDNTAIHAKMVTVTNADKASIAAHADLNQAIATSQTNARGLAQRIKKSTGYNEVIGKTLQIIGEEDTTDMTQEKPVLGIKVLANGVVEVSFGKMLAEGVHIYGKRDGEAGFTYLSSETHSAYVDNRPLLVAGKPETRQYYAVFFIGKAEIGLQSDIATATARP